MKSHRTLKCTLQLLVVIPLLAFASKGMTGDYIPIGADSNSPASATAAKNRSAISSAKSSTIPPIPSNQPLGGEGYMTPFGLTDKQADAALGSLLVGSEKPDFSEIPQGAAAAAGIRTILESNMADDILTEAMNKGTLDKGIVSKALKHNSEIRASIERHYQEYQRLAEEGKVTPELRDEYAKEKIGPRLDNIYHTEINWLGKNIERSRMAGQVQARIELVKIEHQVGEKDALRHADEVVLEQLKYKIKSQDPDYQPLSQEVAQRRSLEIFNKSVENSPQGLEAERLKKASDARAEYEKLVARNASAAQAKDADAQRAAKAQIQSQQQTPPASNLEICLLSGLINRDPDGDGDDDFNLCCIQKDQSHCEEIQSQLGR